MHRFSFTALSTLALSALAILGCGDTVTGQSGSTPATMNESSRQGLDIPQAGTGRRLAVELRGTASGEEREIDGVPMLCFDVDIHDLATGRRIGTGTDCLDLATIAGGDPTVEGFAISNTTIFNLPGGMLKSRNRTTIQPVIEGSPGLTHTTGDVPDTNNVLEGDGRYADTDGLARLSGAVDMSRFFDEGIISFNCIFVIELER